MSSFTPKYNNLVELYEESIKKFAGRPLFGTKQGDEWKWMTYGEFGKQVDQARGGLASLGVHKGDVVAIISNNRPQWAVAAYATYGLGGQFVPMYEAQKDSEWRYILNDCGAKICFVADEETRDRVLGFRTETPKLAHVVVLIGEGKKDTPSLSFDELLAKGDAKPTPTISPSPKDIAGFIYTSGTTGNPKGVLLSHSNLANNVSAMHEIFPMEPDDCSLSFLPWAHSFGQVCELHGLFSMGASMGIAESVDKIIANLSEVRPTLLFSVPRIFNRIYDGVNKKMSEEGGLKQKLFNATLETASEIKKLEEKGESSGWLNLKHKFLDKVVAQKIRDRFGGRLKYAFSGGAALSKEVALFIDSLGILVYEGYGLTETSPIATANYLGARKIGSVGKPIPGVTIDIDKSITGDAENGEIVIHGHNIMQGYHNLPEEDSKVFTKDRGFRTGDMGRLDADGFLYITGRIKEQYKLENGKYVVPSPLEEHLKLSPYITNVLVHGDNKPFNVALVVADMPMLTQWATDNGLDVTDPKKLVTEDKVKKLLESEVEKYSGEFKQFEKVKKIAIIDEDFSVQNDMLTPSLKVKRRVVMSRYGSMIDGLYG